MPQLSGDLAQKTAEAEGGNFEPVPEDVYLATLDCDVEVNAGVKAPYWKWTFIIPEGQEYAGRKFWTNTSLSENALWKLKEIFEAFGVPTSYNTEDLVGRQVKLVVIQRIAEKGSRAGEMVNEIKQVLPASEDAAAAATSTAPTGAKAKKDDVPLF